MTPRQKQVLDFLHLRIGATGVCPSYEEISEALGLSRLGGKARVHSIVKLLEADGFIRRTPGRYRAIELLRPPPGIGPGSTGLSAADLAWCHAHADRVRALIESEAR